MKSIMFLHEHGKLWVVKYNIYIYIYANTKPLIMRIKPITY